MKPLEQNRPVGFSGHCLMKLDLYIHITPTTVGKDEYRMQEDEVGEANRTKI